MEQGPSLAPGRLDAPSEPEKRESFLPADLCGRLDAAPHAEAVLDGKLRYQHVNEAFARLGEAAVAHHVGKIPSEVAPVVGELLEPILRDVLSAARPILGWEGSLPSAGGHTVHLLGNFYPVLAPDGTVASVSATLFDVTGLWWAEHERAEFLRHEQAAHAASEHENRLKDEFLARVSHELRTPLSSMLMWLHLLRVGTAKSRPAAFDALEQSAHAQLRVIDDLLDVARGLSGKLRINRDALRPGPTIAASIQALRPSASSKSIRIATDIDGDVGSIVGDAGRLRQIVTNLVANAIKFTPPGGRVRIGLDRVGDQVRIEVSDSGVGMTAEFLPRAFSAFSQADGSGTRSHDGLGLGLAIVHQLVGLHRGTVHAESAGEGKGSTFTVVLPAKPIVVERPKRVRRRSGFMKLLNLAILVVEDDDLARDALALLLESQGAQVVTAASVAEAIEELGRAWPDALISDIAMPIEDGYALIRRVRALAAERGTPLPAAALTAFAMPEDQARVLEAGYEACMAKPVSPSDLFEVVLGLVGRPT